MVKTGKINNSKEINQCKSGRPHNGSMHRLQELAAASRRGVV
jgi:hypothetical protein